MTVSVTSDPRPGSVFSPTAVKGIVESFHAHSLRDDLPPCEFVEAEFDGLRVTVEDLGNDDRGASRRECLVLVGGVVSDFGDVCDDGFAPDGSTFGSRPVSDATIERIRRWSVGHGMPDHGPVRSHGR